MSYHIQDLKEDMHCLAMKDGKIFKKMKLTWEKYFNTFIENLC